MQKLKSLITIAGVAALMGVASPVMAEAAPVFDVDTFEAGNDAQSDQELPMPPAPGEDGQRAQQASESSGAVTSPAGVSAGATSTAQSDDASSQTFKPVEDDSHAVGNVAADSSEHSSAMSVGAVPASKSASGVAVSTENLTPDQRMRRLEQQIANLQNSQSAAQVNSLQGEVQSLRGQIESLNHELEKVRAQEKTKVADAERPDATASSDVDTLNAAGASAKSPAPAVKKTASKKPSPHASETDELSGAAATTTLASNTTVSTPKDQPNVAEEQQIYQTAYDLIKAKKYDEAVTALQGMLKKYPAGQFASNAHYWLGELYGLMSKNDKALDEFTTVITKFPGSPRVSDAQLKVGLILAAQSKWSDAKKAFRTVINTYPGTASSRLASEQLKQIKLAGH